MKGARVDEHDRVFTETGFVKMTQARNHYCIDMILSYIAGMVEHRCGTVETSVSSALYIFLIYIKLYIITMSTTGGERSPPRVFEIILISLK